MNAPLTPPRPGRSRVALVGGLLLTLPAFVLLVATYIRPGILTVMHSFQKINLLHPDTSSGNGIDNYRDAGPGLGRGLAFSASRPSSRPTRRTAWPSRSGCSSP